MNQQEEQTGMVIDLTAFLTRRHAKLRSEIDTLYEKAKKVSKRPDPRDDPFAVSIMKKIDPLLKKLEKVEHQLKFLRRGGQGTPIPNHGYAINLPPQPASVNFKFSFPPSPTEN